MLSAFGRSLRWLAGIVDPTDNEADRAIADDDTKSNVDDDTKYVDDGSAKVNFDGGADFDPSVDISTLTLAHDYKPTILEVLVVKAMLTKACYLPPEIVDVIVDYAGYWPHTTAEVTYGNDLHTMKAITSFIGDEMLVRTPPLGFLSWPERETPTNHIHDHPPTPNPPGDPFPPEAFQTLIGPSLVANPCRKIVFTIRSHDQGWNSQPADRGTYNHSWTWFEAGLERWYRTPSSSSPSLDLHDLCTVQPAVVVQGQPPQTEEEDTSQSDEEDTSHSDEEDTSQSDEEDASQSDWEDASQSDEEDAPPQPSAHTFHHELLPSETWTIQRNRTADGQTREHRVVWGWMDGVDTEAGAEALAQEGRGKGTGSGEFVRGLRLGDVVTVWAKARFPGWVNYVESVKVEVYWAV